MSRDNLIARLRSESGPLGIWAADEIERLRLALKFVADLTAEELPHAKVGTGTEVALRHANRRAADALDGKVF